MEAPQQDLDILKDAICQVGEGGQGREGGRGETEGGTSVVGKAALDSSEHGSTAAGFGHFEGCHVPGRRGRAGREGGRNIAQQ